MRLSIIVAVADNGVIGRDNRLPWRLSAGGSKARCSPGESEARAVAESSRTLMASLEKSWPVIPR